MKRSIRIKRKIKRMIKKVGVELWYNLPTITFFIAFNLVLYMMYNMAFFELQV